MPPPSWPAAGLLFDDWPPPQSTSVTAGERRCADKVITITDQTEHSAVSHTVPVGCVHTDAALSHQGRQQVQHATHAEADSERKTCRPSPLYSDALHALFPGHVHSRAVLQAFLHAAHIRTHRHTTVWFRCRTPLAPRQIGAGGDCKTHFSCPRRKGSSQREATPGRVVWALKSTPSAD